jgi:hypothetical protein
LKKFQRRHEKLTINIKLERIDTPSRTVATPNQPLLNTTRQQTIPDMYCTLSNEGQVVAAASDLSFRCTDDSTSSASLEHPRQSMEDTGASRTASYSIHNQQLSGNPTSHVTANTRMYQSPYSSYGQIHYLQSEELHDLSNILGPSFAMNSREHGPQNSHIGTNRENTTSTSNFMSGICPYPADHAVSQTPETLPEPAISHSSDSNPSTDQIRYKTFALPDTVEFGSGNNDGVQFDFYPSSDVVNTADAVIDLTHQFSPSQDASIPEYIDYSQRLSLYDTDEFSFIDYFGHPPTA